MPRLAAVIQIHAQMGEEQLLGEKVHASSETMDHVSLLREQLKHPFVDLSPAVVGLEDCDSPLTHSEGYLAHDHGGISGETDLLILTRSGEKIMQGDTRSPLSCLETS